MGKIENLKPFPTQFGPVPRKTLKRPTGTLESQMNSLRGQIRRAPNRNARNSLVRELQKLEEIQNIRSRSRAKRGKK